MAAMADGTPMFITDPTSVLAVVGAMAIWIQEQAEKNPDAIEVDID